MAFPELTTGENTLLHTRSHWKVLIPPYVLGLIGIVACIAGLWATNKYAGDMGEVTKYLKLILWIMLLVTIMYKMVWPYIVWRCTHYVVTNKRVMWQAGVIKKDGTSINVSRITSVDKNVDVNDRIFGCGTLDIITAGGGPDDGGRIRFVDVPKVSETYQALYGLVDTA